jgi:ribosome maturation protein Sdo1
MATAKKFAVAGVSTLNGKTKIRFANDTMRIKILAKNGHTNVELVSLPHEMTKAEIAAYLTSTGFGSDSPAVQEAIRYIAKKNPAPEAVKTPAVKAAAVTA